MKDRICIVTGANRGLGLATARGLAELGARVILTSRDKGRGEAAISAIRSAVDNAEVELLPLDLSSQQSIREMAGAFADRYDQLDVLINNAGVFTTKRVVTAEGMELMFATNHLGPFLLTNLLLDHLKATAGARILTVTAPSSTPLDFEDLQGEKRFQPWTAFGASKMGNLLFTYELARRLEGTGVTANAIHPGLMRSDLMREAPAPLRWLLHLLSATPERAAATPIYLASSPDVAGVSGKFFKNKRPVASAPYSHDRDAQRRLWEVSAALTGIG
jgi:NAD(P)-dependent dehydrogenase (short-subunit alcohol dehydrogenase family)